LFNRLLRRRRSLVHDLPGVTRDVLEGAASTPDGRAYRLLDTGGFDPAGHEEIPLAVAKRAAAAIRTADLAVLVIDAAAGILPGDLAAARMIREAGVEAVVAANKIDRKDGEAGEGEAWELGFREVYGISAEHNLGVDELIDAIARRLPEQAASGEEAEPEEREIALAIVGRPNVGKSSLINALLGEERAIVSEIAGTTRDSVDAVLRHGQANFRLIDTAGIRRKAKTKRGPEVLSVVQARKRIEECDVALLVLDAGEGVTSQDAQVAAYVDKEGKGLVIVANKWDLATRPGKEGDHSAKEFRLDVEEAIPFARHAPVLLASAKTRKGLSKILGTVTSVAQNRRRRITTAELNRLLGVALRDQPPRSASGRILKVYYVAQTGVAPPTFTLVGSRQERLHFSEERRIENILRKSADFSGTPIRISVRARSSSGRKVERRRSKRWSNEHR
jgi:GTP-binding protein